MQLSRHYLIFILLGIPQLRLILGLTLESGVDGEVMMKLLVGALEWLFIALKLLEREPLRLSLGLRRLAGPALLWLVWMLLASLFSEHVVVALLRSVEWLTHALFLVALVSHLGVDPERQSEAIHALLLGFALFFLECVYFFSFFEVEWFKAVPAFSHIRHFGHFALLAAFLAMAYDRRAAWGAGFVFRKLVLLMAWTALMMAAGRGPLLAIVAVSLPLWLMGFFSRERQLPYLFALAAVLGAALSAAVSSPDWGVYRIFGTLGGAGDINAFSSSRLDIWAMALRDIAAQPLFGLGPDGYRLVSGPLFNGILHPHNLPLQAALEWGLPGALLFAYILYQWLAVGLRRATGPEGDINQRVFTWLALVWLAYSLLTGNLYIPFSAFLFVVVMALIGTSPSGPRPSSAGKDCSCRG